MPHTRGAASGCTLWAVTGVPKWHLTLTSWPLYQALQCPSGNSDYLLCLGTHSCRHLHFDSLDLRSALSVLYRTHSGGKETQQNVWEAHRAFKIMSSKMTLHDREHVMVPLSGGETSMNTQPNSALDDCQCC